MYIYIYIAKSAFIELWHTLEQTASIRVLEFDVLLISYSDASSLSSRGLEYHYHGFGCQ